MDMKSIINATAAAYGVRPEEIISWNGGAGNVPRQTAAYVAVEIGIPSGEIESALGMTSQLVKLASAGIRASVANGANRVLADKTSQILLIVCGGVRSPHPMWRPACRPAAPTGYAPTPRRAYSSDPKFRKAFWIDGLNMAYSGRQTADLAIVTAIADDLARRGAEYRVFWDASSWFKLRDNGRPGDCNRYKRLINADPVHHVQVTSGTPADMAVLMEATARPGSMMITGDKYRDEKYQRLYPVCNDFSRFLRGTVSGDAILFPEWNWRVKLPVASAVKSF